MRKRKFPSSLLPSLSICASFSGSGTLYVDYTSTLMIKSCSLLTNENKTMQENKFKGGERNER